MWILTNSASLPNLYSLFKNIIKGAVDVIKKPLPSGMFDLQWFHFKRCQITFQPENDDIIIDQDKGLKGTVVNHAWFS